MRPSTDAIAYLCSNFKPITRARFFAQTLEEMLSRGIVNMIYYILKQFKENSRLEIRGSGFENGGRLFLESHNLR